MGIQLAIQLETLKFQLSSFFERMLNFFLLTLWQSHDRTVQDPEISAVSSRREGSASQPFKTIRSQQNKILLTYFKENPPNIV